MLSKGFNTVMTDTCFDKEVEDAVKRLSTHLCIMFIIESESAKSFWP